MDTNEYKNFISSCKEEMRKDKNVDIRYDIFDQKQKVFKNYKHACQKAANLRVKYINQLDTLANSFEKNFSANGAQVNWAVEYNIVIEDIINIIRDAKLKEINLLESSFTEELGLSRSFKVEEILMDSTKMDCVIVEPKFAISKTGSLYFEFPNAFDRELVLSSKIKIFVLQINNIIKNLEDLELFLNLYAINKEGQEFPSLSTIFTPSAQENNDTYIYLIDNSRTNILEQKERRKALTCIACGACRKVCPIYSLIGDKPYNNVFTGPIANVILPFLETIDGYKHLSFNCTLCGRCTQVCPMDIPLTDLMIDNRNMFFEGKNIDMKERYKIKLLKDYLISRPKLNQKAWVKGFFLNLLFKNTIADSRPLPSFAKQTFSQKESSIA